ncbi:MAG: polymer-forming cytoskeletal protein [Deltaproteobacteria bacterium]|nr:polymer-forming cytoskeletal protein [Deltaproteobacteria bacterium]
MTEPTAPRPRAVAASSGELNALLGRGTRFEGKLTFEGKVRVDGHLSGEVFADGTLVVGEDAVLEARVEVATLIVRGGTVRGNVRATVAVEVYAPGRVFGDITAPEVFLDKGVVFEGRCHMTELEPGPIVG